MYDIPWEALRDVMERRHGMGEVRPLYGGVVPDTRLADTSDKFLVYDCQHRPSVLLSLSAAAAPGMVAREVEAATAAKARLGVPLGDVILTPLAQGFHNGCSYAVWPYCRSFTTFRPIWWLQRASLRRVLLQWLRGVTETTVEPVDSDDIERCFATPLRTLGDNTQLDKHIRQEALAALDGLMKGRWQAVHVLAHNDFWAANILKSPRTRDSCADSEPAYPFTVIDWAGASVHGYAIYDLIRISESLRVPAPQLQKELALHCTLLQCGLADARSHLLAGLGMLGLRLEHFPVNRYLALVKNCCDMLF